jgi:hypothetical protein
MVATSEEGKPKQGENQEVEDAEDAKKAADPVIDDPRYMPNIEPQTGDGGKAKRGEVDSGEEPNPANPENSPQASNPPPAQTGD